MTANSDFADCFPFKQIRPEQEKAMRFAIDAFLVRDRRFVVLEMGTGCGKSATGIAISRLLGGSSYVLTTQKILQDQYAADFAGRPSFAFESLKSSSNYSCASVPGHTCAETRRITSQERLLQVAPRGAYEKCRTGCPYKTAKERFIGSDVGVTNFAYFLAETMYAGQLKPRDLLVIDEAHNIEGELSRFIEITFSEAFAQKFLGLKTPKFSSANSTLQLQDEAFNWISDRYRKALCKHIADHNKLIEQLLSSGQVDLGSLAKRLEMLDKHICKVNRFCDEYQAKNWVLNVTHGPGGLRKLDFKPVQVSGHTEDKIFKFGQRVLMMSATIVDVDVFCRTIGLDRQQVDFISIPSPFPPENRRVHFMPIGSMSHRSIEQTLPLMAEGLKEVLRAHSDEKGIVHCVSFKVAKYLHEQLNDSRLLLHDSTDREEVLRYHIECKEPTVLLSPSMTEGIDLAGDASRFQVIVKVPFPYLGDEVVRRRMEADPKWYSYQTAKTVIQALGRSVRSRDDHAVSYILDSDWAAFFRRSSQMFSDDFKSTLE